MRWVNLAFAAIFAGFLAAGRHDVEHLFFNAFGTVLAFGWFVNACLERHRP